MSGVLRGMTLHAQPLTLARSRSVQRESAAAPAPALDLEAQLAQAFAQGLAQGRAEEARVRGDDWSAALETAAAQAQEQGRLQGLQEGLQDAAVRAEKTQQAIEHAGRERIERLEDLLQSAAHAVQAWRSESQDDLVALAHDIACRVLGARAIERQALEQMTRHVLREHGPRTPLAVHLHPDDFEFVMQAGHASALPWTWVADPAVETGGVVLRSPQGSLDARLDVQLRALGEALVAHRDERVRIQAKASA